MLSWKIKQTKKLFLFKFKFKFLFSKNCTFQYNLKHVYKLIYKIMAL